MTKLPLKLITRKLRELADNMDAGNSHLTEEEAVSLFSLVAHIAMTKEECCSYLNCSRATFDNYIRAGFMPKGRKRRGTSTLYWYEDEIVQYKMKFSNIFDR